MDLRLRAHRSRICDGDLLSSTTLQIALGYLVLGSPAVLFHTRSLRTLDCPLRMHPMICRRLSGQAARRSQRTRRRTRRPCVLCIASRSETGRRPHLRLGRPRRARRVCWRLMHKCSRKDRSRRLAGLHLCRSLARFEVRTDRVFRQLSQYQVMVSSIACRLKVSSHSRCMS